MRGLLAWFVNRLFPAVPIEETTRRVPDSYRPPPAGEDEHLENCPSCIELNERGRYLPPEVLLEAGYPFPCLTKQMGYTEEELIKMAESYGLKVMRR